MWKERRSAPLSGLSVPLSKLLVQPGLVDTNDSSNKRLFLPVRIFYQHYVDRSWDCLDLAPCTVATKLFIISKHGCIWTCKILLRDTSKAVGADGNNSEDANAIIADPRTSLFVRLNTRAYRRSVHLARFLSVMSRATSSYHISLFHGTHLLDMKCSSVLYKTFNG